MLGNFWGEYFDESSDGDIWFSPVYTTSWGVVLDVTPAISQRHKIVEMNIIYL